VTGVTEGFTKTLEITGVGYRAAMQGKNLRLQLGYSHDVNIEVPAELTVATPDATTVVITGNDKQRVASWPPRSAAGASRSPTRARASISRGVHLPQRRQEEVSHGETLSLRSAPSARPDLAPQARCDSPRSAFIVRAGISMPRSSTMRRAAPLRPLRPSTRTSRELGRPAAPCSPRRRLVRRVAERAQAAGVYPGVFRPWRFSVPRPREGSCRCRARRRIGVLND
jgi:hypothetical protein